MPFEVLRETVHDPIQKPIHGIVAVAMEEAERAEEALKILTGTEKR